MLGKIETKLTPIMKVRDKFGEEWKLEQRPSLYPNMQMHILTYINRSGKRKRVRLNWDGEVIAGDIELGKIIVSKI